MSKQLDMQNGDIYDDPPPQQPLVVLDCPTCPGYQRFENQSATVVECEGCGGECSNEWIVDLNMERL